MVIAVSDACCGGRRSAGAWCRGAGVSGHAGGPVWLACWFLAEDAGVLAGGGI